MKKSFVVSLLTLVLIGLFTASFVLRNENQIKQASRSVTVYYNFVKVGTTAYSHQTTTGEFDSDNMTIIINGKSCNVKECSYYRLRNQGLEVDDPRADYQFQAFCSSLKGDNMAYFN